MSKHTQGPWEVWPHGKDRQICIGHLESHSNLVRAICEVDMDDVANARLIAAAPDLLAAAEALLGHRFYRASGLSDSHAELLGALRAAIAAAKGEE